LACRAAPQKGLGLLFGTMMGYDAAAYQQMYQQQQAALQAAQQAQQAQPQQAAMMAGYGGQMQQQQAYQQQQTEAQVETVGQVAHVTVTGCQHATVSGIVRGNFSASGQNHGKPTYKRDAPVNGLDVMIYFWDERDGPNFCGWWFGPKVGGDQVWAYHSSRTQTPPLSGWKVPYDGAVDPTFAIAPAAQQQPQQQQFGYQQQQQGQAFQQQQGAQGGYGQQQFGQQGGFDQQQQQQQQRQQQIQQAQEQARMKIQQQQQQQQQLQMMKQQQQQKQQEELARKAQMQQEMNRRRMEEQKKIAEQKKKAADEAKASIAIRKVISKVNMAKEETLAQVQQELFTAMQTELGNCGSLAAKVKEEAEQSVENAKKRVADLQAAKAAQEERKAQMIEKHKAACEKADTLVAEFSEKVEEADSAVQSLVETAKPFTEVDGTLDMKEEEIEELAKSIAEAAEEANAKVKTGSDFLKENQSAMKVPDMLGQPTPESRAAFSKTMETVNAYLKTKEMAIGKAKMAKVKGLKRAKAKKALESQVAKFKKYDADKDGALNKKEIVVYAKKEFGFALADAAATKILKVLTGPGAKGVKQEDFQKLKVQVGIQRENALDAQRKKKREQREKEVEAAKVALKEKIGEVDGSWGEIDEKLKKVEEATKPLQVKNSSMKSGEILAVVSEVEGDLKASEEEAAAMKKSVLELKNGAEPELKLFAVSETKSLDSRCKQLDTRLNFMNTSLQRARTDAKKKEAQEISAFEKQAQAMIQHHQKKKEMSPEDVCDALSGGGGETIAEDSFTAFFADCEKEEGAVAPASEDLSRLFKSMEEDGSVSKERMLVFIRHFMKVVKETTITESLSITEGSKRKLAAGEVVEVHGLPTVEGNVTRVKCKALKDDLTGFVTVKGTAGSVFLMDGGRVFKVVKETIMTDHFDLDSQEAKDASKKLEEPRKLKTGELVEVRVWSMKEEKSGLMRMKCRAKNDGKIGWVTVTGNAGTTFLTVA